MAEDVLQRRERGIEAQWARQRDEELIQKLRERGRLDEISRLLARKLRIEDPALRRRILDLGMTHETGPALFVAPLIQVAWADGKVTDRERDAILGMAAVRGVAPGSPSHARILEWLLKPPPQALFDAAVEVLRVGISVLPGAEREERIAAYVDSYRRVAAASRSGIRRALGIGGTAPEEAVIGKVAAALRA